VGTDRWPDPGAPMTEERLMTLADDILDEILVQPGKRADLHHRDTAWKGGKTFEDMATDDVKAFSRERLQQFIDELSVAQELLWASDTYALLVVFQALDAAGKDGTIKHVMSGINPQGCDVVGFKQPSAEELDHDFLWRSARVLPKRGRIGIFNRSYYEEVLVARVHPELIDRQRLPPGSARGDELWKERYRDINDFERHLDQNGTKIVKFFLHVSKKEQRKRFLERLDRPEKHWKFSSADLAERAHWDAYIDAYDEALTATSTPYAPWYVIPADHKYVMRAVVAGVLASAIHGLDLSYPEVSGDKLREIDEARAALLAE
jgi:PPK2 family polyphosphate:nucleotide phosphotransferase